MGESENEKRLPVCGSLFSYLGVIGPIPSAGYAESGKCVIMKIGWFCLYTGRDEMFCGSLRFLVTAAAVPLCAQLMDGVRAVDMSNAIVLGLLLAVVYTVLRPLLRLLLKVVNFCTLGLLYVAVDAWLVWTAAALVENSVQFQNFWWALAVAAVVNAARMAIDALSGDVRR